jgi:uncharacterized membrane protein
MDDSASSPAIGATAGVSLGLILLCLAGTLMLGAATKLPCASGDWSGDRQYRLLCYSDIIPLLSTEHLQGGRLPYLDACGPVRNGTNCDEYPVLTMYFMRVAAWMWNRTMAGYLLANELLLSLCAVAITVCLWTRVGVRALYFVLAPTFVIYAFMNWDLLAVALATGAITALLSRRDRWAGALLGLGAAAKLYPALFVVPFVIHRLRQREPDGAIRLFWTAAATWAAVNAPFAILAPGSWWTFFRLNAARIPDWDSLTYIACRHLHSLCFSTRAVNAGSLAAFIGLSAFVWVWKARRDPDFDRWTLVFPIVVLFLLTNKVYSPQYGLWLLPLFALVLPDLRPFVLFCAADVAVFATRFRFFGSVDGYPWGWPQGWFEIAVGIRALVLVWCVVAWIRRAPEPISAGGPHASEPDSPATATATLSEAAAKGGEANTEDVTTIASTTSEAAAAASAGGPWWWWRAWSPGIGLLLLLTSFTLTGGYLLKAACLDVPWDGRQWTTDCANDIHLLYSLRGLAQSDRFPPQKLEYPPGTVFYVGVANVVTDSARGFFEANAAGIAIAGFATTAMLALLASDRRRVMLFALGPPLFLYAFQNWDLVAVALVVAGLFAAARRRYGWSGAALGLGAAVKLFPLLVLPAILLQIERNGDGRRSAYGRALGAFAASLVIPNAALFALSRSSWSFFWTFQGNRFPNPETSWFMVARHLVGMFPTQAWRASYADLANIGSIALLVVVAVGTLAFVLRRHHSPTVLAFVLLVAAIITSKIFSPQYMLWLLPFFVLLPLPWYGYAAFLIADVAVLLSVNDYYLTIARGGDWPHALNVLEVFTWLRYAVLIWLAVAALRVRSTGSPWESARSPAPSTTAPIDG